MINNNLSLENLHRVLAKYQINTEKWSHKHGNKTVEQLWQEIQDGDSKIDIIDGRLTRLVRVSSIDVRFKLGERYFQLIEDKQILFSGAVKTRNLKTLTEKVRADEDFLTGAYRCLAEEIGLETQAELTFIKEDNFQKLSPHYPHLYCHYHMFKYQLILGETELGLIRFSEYVSKEKRISLFTLKPID